MVRLKAEVYTTAAIARLRKAEQKIMRTAKVSTQELVNMGKNFARAIVPKGTSLSLYKSIQGKTLITNKGTVGKIFIDPVNYAGERSTGGNFNLVEWLAKSKGMGYPVYKTKDGKWYTNKKGTKRLRTLSGSPTFMADTREYLKGAGVNKVRGDFKNIKF